MFLVELLFFFEAAVLESENMFIEHLVKSYVTSEEPWWKRNLKPEKVCEQTSQCLLFRTTGMQGRTTTYPGYTCMKLSVYYSPELP